MHRTDLKNESEAMNFHDGDAYTHFGGGLIPPKQALYQKFSPKKFWRQKTPPKKFWGSKNQMLEITWNGRWQIFKPIGAILGG